jgi:hypothetical protein
MNAHIVNTQVVVRLGKDPQLEEHTALLAVAAALERCRTSAPEAPLAIPGWLDGSLPCASLSSPVIDAALAREERFDLARVGRVLELRLKERLRQPAPAAEGAAAEIRAAIAAIASPRNPYVEARAWRQVSGLLQGAAQFPAAAADVAELLAVAEQAARTTESRAAAFDSAPDLSGAIRVRWTGAVALVVLFMCMFALGVLPLLAALACAVAGAAGWWWFRHGGKAAAATDPANRLRKKLLDEPARLLGAYYDARSEAAQREQRARFAEEVRALLREPGLEERLTNLEKEVRRRVEAIPELPFREVRFGCTLLGGRELAAAIVCRRGIDAIWRGPVDLTDTVAACDQLVASARAEIGRLTLAEALGERPEVLLRPRLQALQVDARMPLALRPGMLMDRRMCPESWSIGVPADAPGLMGIVRSVFPRAAMHDAFMPDSVEVVYVIRNLCHAHLQSHIRAEAPYRASSPMEHQVSHYPRRLCAIH